MSGKQAKREKRREKEAAREAARRKERQQTLATMAVIGIVVAIGGVLIWASLERPAEPVAEPDELEEPEDPEELAEEPPDERPVACGDEAPPWAGQEKPTFEAPEQVLEEGASYQAVIETSCGNMVVALDRERAPQTVNSFVFLAEQGFFDGLEIFRNATSIGALQTGSGTNEAAFSIGYTIEDELGWAQEDGYPAGAVAMANAGPNTAGSQFFFVYNDLFDQAFADQRNYARFGTVIEGLEALEIIGAIPVDGETPREVVYMKQVTIQALQGDQ